MSSRITSRPPKTNRRVSPRRSARGKVECRLGAVGRTPNLANDFEDISQAGARLVVTQAIDPGRRVELRFSGWGHRSPLVVVAKVVWCAVVEGENDLFRIGVRLETNLSYEDWQLMS